MDDTVHTLVEKINSQRISAYQEKTEEKNSIFQTEGKIDKETINNLIINLISEKKLPEISKKI